MDNIYIVRNNHYDDIRVDPCWEMTHIRGANRESGKGWNEVDSDKEQGYKN